MLFVATVAILDGLPAIYFWIRSGISPRNFLIAVSFLMISFLSLLAIMALAALQRNGPAPGILLAFLTVTMSAILAERAQLFKVISAKWLQHAMTSLYYVLPKISDLNTLARKFLATGTIGDWMPVWSTLLFTVVVFAVALAQLERKNL